MPKIAYKEINFRKATLCLIEQINDVVDEYSEQGFDLTLRQVYYQMVTKNIIPNTERSYKNLGNVISDGRLAGLIDWNAIEDRTRYIRQNAQWDDPGDRIDWAARTHHINHWEGQDFYLEVWVEKDALIGVVGQICKKLDVSHFSCRGYVSQSEMWTAAERLKREAEDKNIVLLHLGDHDPSGIDMSRDIQDRLETFGVEDIIFERIALNMDQIEEYNPPPNPAKLTDSRAKSYLAEYGRESWELDALEPKAMSDLIEMYVTHFRNEELYESVLEREREDRKFLKKIARNWDGIESHWDEIYSRYIE